MENIKYGTNDQKIIDFYQNCMVPGEGFMPSCFLQLKGLASSGILHQKIENAEPQANIYVEMGIHCVHTMYYTSLIWLFVVTIAIRLIKYF